MLRSSANAVIRVAVFPVLLLFWQYVFGTDMPLLAPAMCAVFLTTSHAPPPLFMVFLMAGMMYLTACLQVGLGMLLSNFAPVYYLALLGVFYWCMDRTRKNAQDLMAILMIVSTAMIAVFIKQKAMDVGSIPLALLENIFIAGLVAYLAYFIFPGGEPLAESASSAAGDNVKIPHQRWHTLFKASFVLLILLIGITLNLDQSTIMAIVVALIIKDPVLDNGHDYATRRLLTTYASLVYAIPPILACIFQANLIAQIGISIVCALFMGIHAIEEEASYNSIQLLYSSYVVLIYYAMTTGSLSALSDDIVRFASIVISIILGLMGLFVIRPKVLPLNRACDAPIEHETHRS